MLQKILRVIKCGMIVSMSFALLFGCSRDTESHKKTDNTTEAVSEADITVGATESAETETTPTVEVQGLNRFSFYNYNKKEILCENDGKSIYGVAWVPETEERVPLVIISPGIAASYDLFSSYARQLALHGIAAYTFDFCGGSDESKSDGKTTEMSILTEVTDLEAVLDAAQTWDFVNPDKIALFGESQGAVVSAIVASDHADLVKGLIQICPAYIIFDEIHVLSPALEYYPETFVFLDWLLVGKKYVEDIWDFDIYDRISNFKNKVLVLNGSEDQYVSVESVQPLLKVYDDVEFHVIEGGEHGFHNDIQFDSFVYIFKYLQSIDF